MAKTKQLLDLGFLDNVFNKNIVQPKSILLSTTDLMVISNIYGHLYGEGDLYELLFEDEDRTFNTPAGRISSRDLRAFTVMRYLLSPNSYWKSDKGTAYKDTAYCGGTPLALLGARNKYNVSYNTWHKDIDKDNIDQVYKVDLFLGHTFASTVIDPENGSLTWAKKDGLLRFKDLPLDLFQADEILEIRILSGHSNTAYNTKEIKAALRNIEYYNDATVPLRHLIRQTWCWHGQLRSSNMICHWSDWDKITKDVDALSQQIKIKAPEAAAPPPGFAKLVRGK